MNDAIKTDMNTKPSDVTVDGVTLGEPWEREQYRFLNRAYDVRLAFEIIRDNPRPPVYADTDEMARGSLGYSIDEDGNPAYTAEAIEALKDQPHKITMGTHVDWEAVPTVDHELAGIVATVERDEGKPLPLIIDGHHRLARRWQLGLEKSYFFVLTAEETTRVELR